MTPDQVSTTRRTIDASDNPAVLNAMRTRNNGRYNGNGREWGTPPELFAKLDAEFHFTLDACAAEENAKVARYFNEAQNGLEQDWGQETVFMNPPYGKEIYAWTKKAREASERGAFVVGLLPASTDLAWWHDDVEGHAEYRFLRGRVRFITGGKLNASGFFASVVVIWRPKLVRVPARIDSAEELAWMIGGLPDELITSASLATRGRIKVETRP